MRLKDQGKKVNITNSTNNKEQVTVPVCRVSC